MRRLLIGLFALAAIAGAAVGAWWALVADDESEIVRQTAQRFVTAWSAEDWEALDEVTGGEAGEAHAEAHEHLDVSEASIDLSRLDVDDLEESAPATFEATLSLEDLGVWSYVGSFRVVRVGEDAWEVDWAPEVLHPDLGEAQELDRARNWAERAPILGHDDEPLSGSGEVVTVGVEPQHVADHDELARELEQLTDANEDEVAELLAGDLEPDWFYPVATMPPDAVEEVREELAALDGIVFQEETDRVPANAAVGELVGGLDQITAEQLDELGPPYREGDVVGRTGLEARFEEELAGRPGGEVRIVGEDGTTVTVLADFDPVEPEPLATALDANIQQAAAEVLEAEGRGSAIVALDPASGGVRAAVSRPRDEFPRALTGRYAPGSTFKLVTAAALLDAGTEPDETVACEAQRTAGGRVFTNAGDLDLGDIPFAEAFVESCNTAFIDEALELGGRHSRRTRKGSASPARTPVTNSPGSHRSRRCPSHRTRPNSPRKPSAKDASRPPPRTWPGWQRPPSRVGGASPSSSRGRVRRRPRPPVIRTCSAA
ncbi:hypothetical protein ER308_21150 [Egibacter rhizosphaerae]|uniref:Penicillin-binding protein n=1 Tax=Egibacter rhizosphaerae TaxID=1670831 RepID=A0A411YKU1_9ACTN|nr:hypothetical protein ER308_21150 [Egibacter rhizosphaerae]